MCTMYCTVPGHREAMQVRADLRRDWVQALGAGAPDLLDHIPLRTLQQVRVLRHPRVLRTLGIEESEK
jgi:hypothetical protein